MLDVLYLLSTLSAVHPGTLAVPKPEIILAAGQGQFMRLRGAAVTSDIAPPIPVDPVSPSADAGPVLPLSYTVSALPGTEYYVATGGGGSTCSSGAPCGTLAAAQTAASSDDSIVVRGGTYRTHGSSCTWSAGVCTYTSQTSITKRLTIACYPGETCIFDGAQDVTAAFAAGTVEGGNTWIAYSPIPVTDGSGTNFATSGSNLTGSVEGAGKFPDQAWIGTAELQQVQLKSQVVAGKFWVDSTFPLANTVSVSSTAGTAGSAARRTVTGSGTAFTKVLVAGDSITVGAVGNSLATPTGTLQTRTIASITDDTHLIVTADFTTTATATRVRRNGNHRLYLATADADCNGSTCEASNKGNFLSISTSDVALRGLKIMRYSNTAARFGVVIINNPGDRTEISDTQFDANALVNVSIAGDATAGLVDDMEVTHVSVTGSHFLGLNPVYTHNLDVDKFLCTGADAADEFTASPQSGCIKTSRTADTRIVNSYIADNRSIGIWLDQSNMRATACNNTIINNGTVAGETSFFFEISDKLLLCNNLLQSPVRPAAKMSGSSGIRAWNNTFIGGSDPFEMTADSRSNVTGHCADPAFASCSGSPGSDRWTSSILPRAATMDWMPRLDEMFNNIVQNPTAVSDVCAVASAFCINAYHPTAPGSEATIQSIIHPADGARGIPVTSMNTNVYANGMAGNIIARRSTSAAATTYTQASLAAWTSYLAGAPVSISGLDAASIADPTGSTYVDAAGVPTGALNHTLATAAPTDAALNEFVPAGTKHFGVTWR